MSNELCPINVIPDTPPLASALELLDCEPSFYDNKGHLSYQGLNSYEGSSAYLNSPISSGSSSRTLSPISQMLDSFSLSETLPGGVDEPLICDSIWAGDHNVLSAASASISARTTATEGLHLNISHNQSETLYPSNPSPIDISISLEEFDNLFRRNSSAMSMNPNISSDEDYFQGTDSELYSSQFQEASSSLPPLQDAWSLSSLSPSPLFPTPSSLSCGTSAPSSSLLSPTSLPDANRQRRYSHSDVNARNGPAKYSTSICTFLLSPNSQTTDGTNSLFERRHTLSNGNASSSPEKYDPSASSSISRSSDTFSDGNNVLQRRHSHSQGSQPRLLADDTQPPRRWRSTTAVRCRSPYARTRELTPTINHLTPDSSPGPTSLIPVERCESNRTPESPSPSSSQDIFRSYDGRSGVGYPMLQRDTIASDAVLEAAARRRKKPATYKCGTCNQLLTSKDNLKNHQDAHDGIRRHKCMYCPERFRTRSVLKRHQKSTKCPASRLLVKKQSQNKTPPSDLSPQ
ncbi:hypothetical protein D9615_004266 [Tricholomella constricta]|uniref:C2H2-type domain-containing protein n=1 Tax=Tricholomella constricta TaxID=117010 RepID=A0A8H5M690_9AGAR|nr:hypothetical protein D9615_004266 [Tricholomella constricta]